MNCLFCSKAMNFSRLASLQNAIIKDCYGCQQPNYNTTYRILLEPDTDITIRDYIYIDDFIVVRVYPRNNQYSKSDTTSIFRKVKERIGVRIVSVCDINEMVRFEGSSAETIKRRISLWTTFS